MAEENLELDLEPESDPCNGLLCLECAEFGGCADLDSEDKQ